MKRLLLILALLGVAGCPDREKKPTNGFLGYRPPHVETYFATTKDNWQIALHRFMPDTPRPDRVPVLLCHGLGYNGRFWCLDAEHDFPSYLRDAGYDTWLVDLRGSGESAKPAWRVIRSPELNPNELRKLKMDNQDWSADEHILYDVPAVIDFVRKETGHNRVAWIGHSLGSMVMLGYLERFDDAKVQCLGAVAAPMIIPRPPNNILRDIPGFRLLMKMVNNRLQALAGAATLNQFKTPVDTLFYNADNVTLPVIMELFLRATEDIPSEMIEQTMTLAETGEFVSRDGTFNYTAELHRVTLPILFVAAKVDNMADCEGVRHTYHQVSSSDKTFRLFGLANGDSADYGHDDLIIGRASRKEVFPFILSWLDEKARVPGDSSPK